jgi:hypothetical protein
MESLWNKNELTTNYKLEFLKIVGGVNNELSMEYVKIME